MTKLLSIFILFFTITNLSYSQPNAEIYNRVINDFIIKKNVESTDSNNEVTIVTLDKPSHLFKEITLNRLRESYRKLSKEVFNDFYLKNQKAFKLEEFYTPNFKLVIFSKDTIPNQQQIADKYPKWNHVIIELSDIGFNKRKNEAMVYYGQNIGSRAAGGIYVIYKLKKGKWKQKKIIPAWST